jgi:hypothetical protein
MATIAGVLLRFSRKNVLDGDHLGFGFPIIKKIYINFIEDKLHK